jgi:hypothetical protein
MTDMKKILVRIFSILVVVTLGVFINSCNNSNSKKEEKSDTTTVSDKSKVSYALISDPVEDQKEDSLFRVEDSLLRHNLLPRDRVNATYDVTLRADQLDFLINTAWSGDPLVALKFKFYGKDNKYSVKVCGVDKDGDRTEYVKLDYTTLGAPTFKPNPHGLKRNVQMLTFTDLRIFLGLQPNAPLDHFVDMYITANPNGHSAARDVMFLHYSSEPNKVNGSVSQLAVTQGSGDTNPCPPCPYCLGKCPETMASN